MARASSLLLFLTLGCLASAQPFGRFGYHDTPVVPGLTLDREGFRANYATADKLRFYVKPSRWNVIETSDMRQTVVLSTHYRSPAKLRVDLTAPGITLFCPQGLALKVTSTAAPYLTWTEGSVRDGVPTPSVSWVVLSFADNQPPYIFGVPGGKTSFQVSGRPGSWDVEAPTLTGWLRVGLPLGIRPAQANTASSLGELGQRVSSVASLFTAMPPDLKSVQTKADMQSITATWTFDNTGAVMPSALFFSPFAGYAPQVLSPNKRIEAPTEEGPVDVCTTTRLTVRFPIKRVPTGRAIALDPPSVQPVATVSYLDAPSVVGLALENLVSTRDTEARATAEAVYGEFLSQATYSPEPITGQKLPYNTEGLGIDLCAAHALLMQSTTSTLKPTSEENSLLTSVAWRMDWLSWRLWTDNRQVGRRASALAALAAAICPEPERRLLAGMLHAGLAAERGLQIWQRRQGMIPQETPLLDTMPSMRQALFTIQATEDAEGQFAYSLLSPLRAFGTTPVRLNKVGDDLVLAWPATEAKPSLLTLASGFPIKVKPKTNLGGIGVSQAFGFTELRYTPEIAGQCEATLILPSWAKPIPTGFPVPAFSETVR